jgi:hypothetical protein
MTDEEAAAQIKERCSHGDTEAAHGVADDILCDLLKSLGYVKTVEAWEAVDKWYA